MAKAAAIKRYRHEAWAVAKAAGLIGGPMRSATVQMTFYYRDSRRRDRDNALASMKAALDGIADAEIVSDDVDFTHLPVTISVDRSRPRVEIVVREHGSGDC